MSFLFMAVFLRVLAKPCMKKRNIESHIHAYVIFKLYFVSYVHIFYFCGSPSSVSFAFVCCGVKAAVTLCACRSLSSLGFFRTYGEQAPCTAWCEIFARGCHDTNVHIFYTYVYTFLSAQAITVKRFYTLTFAPRA